MYQQTKILEIDKNLNTLSFGLLDMHVLISSYISETPFIALWLIDNLHKYKLLYNIEKLYLYMTIGL